jgi:hypothetical protein
LKLNPQSVINHLIIVERLSKAHFLTVLVFFNKDFLMPCPIGFLTGDAPAPPFFKVLPSVF